MRFVHVVSCLTVAAALCVGAGLVPSRVARVAGTCASAAAAEPEWHASLEKGIEAAKKSGKPVFVVAIWKPGVCASCDSWRDRVPKDADVVKALARFERVEWLYDGLNGKIIPWTLANGGTSTDPSAQCFVVGLDGKVASRLEDAKAYTPSSVSEWLKAEADRFEKDHPRTALAFARAVVAVDVVIGSGATSELRTATCAEVDAAREAKRPVLLYFGRDAADDDKTRAAEASASRKFEKGALDSKAAADAAGGWTLLRFDVADAAHAEYAKSLGVEKVPALLVWEPGADKPSKLATTLTGPDLAFKLKKLAPSTPK